MTELLITALIFCCLMLASLGGFLVSEKRPVRYRPEDTESVVRHVAGFFVVMTSLVLGLMINSATDTFEDVDHNVHAFATQVILLDRSLEQYGPETNEARRNLTAYLRQAIDETWPPQNTSPGGQQQIDDKATENLLSRVGNDLKAIKPDGTAQTGLWSDAQQQFQKLVELRWTLVEQSKGTISVPLLILVMAWLVLVFASFGYGAPRNSIVVTTFVLSAILISSSLYLILDMDIPFSGPIQVDSEPMQRVLLGMEQ